MHMKQGRRKKSHISLTGKIEETEGKEKLSPQEVRTFFYLCKMIYNSCVPKQRRC